jgi:hypothetical protein
MKNLILSVVPPMLLLAAASAQEPSGASRQPANVNPSAAGDTELQSLQTLVTETVYVRQPSSANPGGAANAGSAADVAFARIRDAEFGPDGRLASLIVDNPPNAKGGDKVSHVLSASSVRFDAATRRWLTVETTLQLAELPAYEGMKDKKTPVANPKGRPVLASELLRSEASTEPAKAGGVAEASGKKAPAARIVWWFAPGAQQVAVAVVPMDGKHLLVPFAALRIDGGEMPRVRIESTAGTDGAPACANADELPSKALRQQCYAHYGVTPPAWEKDADTKGKPKDKEKDKKDKPPGDGQVPDKG